MKNIVKSFDEFIRENHKNTILNFDKIRNTHDKDVKKFLDSISDEEIKKIWMQLLLNEALINTYPVDKTVEYISSYFDFIPEQIKVYKAEAENKIFHII